MLETPRLTLKIATMEEASAMLELNRDYEVIRYTGDDHLHTIEAAQAVIKDRLIPQYEKYKMGRFSVYLKNTNEYIGWCGLRYFPESDEVDLGYRFMKKDWGKGYATEASLACLKYGFETLKLKRIVAKAMPENIASIKVLQKLKMTFRGYVKDPSEPHAFILYDITADEYQACKK